jgi:GT2 family glycosyltransferase
MQDIQSRWKYLNTLPVTITVAIPTYRREQVLLDTLHRLLRLGPPPSEILVLDQTEQHDAVTTYELESLAVTGRISWIRLPKPSITHAMNEALLRAKSEVVLFLDDDVKISPRLVSAHVEQYRDPSVSVVVGQVIQPWEEALPPDTEAFRDGNLYDPDAFRFNSSERRWIQRVMGGNLSVRRNRIIELGGFDENFVQAAYRFEAEFSERVLAAGEKILFEPTASLYHLKVDRGGTRSYGHHLTTVKPSHSVGEYYYLMRSRQVDHRFQKILTRPLRAVKTKHHLSHPWWIPLTLISELLGFFWALKLYWEGPKYVQSTTSEKTKC